MTVAFPLIIALLIVWILGVWLYSRVAQPEGTVSLGRLTNEFSGFYSNRMELDVNRLHEYALLSEVVYERLNADNKRLTYADVAQNALNNNSSAIINSLSTLWTSADHAVVNNIIEQALQKPRLFNEKDNFHMEVYVRARPNQNNKTEVALVYRGTDDRSDFFGNFYWLTRFIPMSYNQYDITQIVTPLIIDNMPDLLGKNAETIEYVSTGHSLGGGLAQMAAYSDKRIRSVYAFDASAVTGFFGVPRAERREAVRGLRIYRIHAWGEVLAYMREAMRILWPVASINPQIVEIRFRINPDKGKQGFMDRIRDNFLSKHGMGELAIGIRNAWLSSQHNDTT